MYNIDFKVSGHLVSVPVTVNDSLSTVINKMKTLDPFNKYSHSEIKEKIVRNLTHISSSPSIDPQIQMRIAQLLNPKPKSFPHQIAEVKSNLNNHTFVNLLQETTINTSCSTSGIASETKLRRKYISNEPLQNDEQFFQTKLKFNYNKRDPQGNKNVIPSRKNQVKPNPNWNKPTFSYLQQQPRFQKNSQTDYKIDLLLKKRDQDANKQNCKYKNSLERSPLKSNKLDANFYNTKSPNSPSKHRYNLDKNCHPKNQCYNPVPKVNELIQKSRSLSLMVKINSDLNLKQINPNLQIYAIEKRKILPSSELLEFDKRKTAGKIHHRQDFQIENQKKNLRDEQNLKNYKQNLKGQRYKSFERSWFSLKINYNTQKINGRTKETGIKSLVKQNEEKQNNEWFGQNKGKYESKNGIYSYL